MIQQDTISTKRPAAMLTALFLGTFMALLDVSIVTIALPSIQADLHASLADLQWVLDGYVVALAAVMLTGGALADRFGRKRVFLMGLSVFTLASLACGLAPSVEMLITARVVQGAAASVVTPGAMSLIAQAFPQPAERARVIGLWASVAGMALVLGPLLGGPLTEALGWQSVFLINIPLGVVVVAIGLRTLRESADPEHSSLDLAGQVLAIVWIGALAYAMIEAGHAGWSSAGVLVTLAVAVVGLAAFVVVELRQDKPMLPIRLLGRREFGLINLASFTIGFGAFATFFFLSIYLQDVRGASPTEAGLQFLPYVLANSVLSLVSGRLVGRFGPLKPLLTGYALLTVSQLGMMTLTATTPYPVVAGLFLLAGLALNLAGVPTNTIALHAVPRERSGIAAATVNATRQTGTALGVAVLGGLIASGATFVDGLHRALLVAGLVTGVVTVAVAIFVRDKAPVTAPAP
nr:DHA2 family efflux MFS transporter permease subunit [Kibdelosporangium sp. MJ126-NF4]CEL19264.1 probable transporter [Kibdelosporangium sp. MJ126-NF4]CTQ94937.1 probable transporter [Kibdelosporangium sp. MJ126-NF4]